MPDPTPSDEIELTTEEFIVEARRPLLIERHRQLIEEMESGLSDTWVTGEVEHPRLKAMLAQLDLDSEQERVTATLGKLADINRYRDHTLRAALVEEMCLLREESGIEVATMQIHAIGVYRRVRTSLGEAQGEAPPLSDLRELPLSRIPLMLQPVTPVFGNPDLADSLLFTPAFAQRALSTFRRLRRPEGADTVWDDAAGAPPLPREVEEPLRSLPESELRATRQLLIRDRLRSRFFRQVFLTYLHRDEFDPSEAEAHPTVLSWLLAIEATAHLYPFMQGQTAGQKAFRLGQLLQKIVQLHEVYARVARASAHPTYRDRFQGLGTRERLHILAQERYPALPLTDELKLGALLCPFATFVAWVQDKVETKDFVIPPDPKR